MPDMIIIQIPHQMPPKAFTATDYGDAPAKFEGNFPRTYTPAQLLESFDEDVLLWKAMDIAQKHGCAVEYVDPSGNSEWFAPGDVPSMQTIVQEWAAHDMHYGGVLENAGSALFFIENRTGHQAWRAIDAVRAEAEFLDWIKPATEEET